MNFCVSNVKGKPDMGPTGIYHWHVPLDPAAAATKNRTRAAALKGLMQHTYLLALFQQMHYPPNKLLTIPLCCLLII